MRKALLIVISCAFLAACKNKNRIPAGVLPQKKMQAVLWDMMRADQFLTDYVINKDSSANRDTESIKLYREIFGIHRITKKEFQRSFAYYNMHPALLKPIMDSLSANYHPLLPPQEHKTDSIAPPLKKPIFIRDSSVRIKKQPKGN